MQEAKEQIFNLDFVPLHNGYNHVNVANFRNYKIEISQDINAVNPFTDWDNMTPMIVNYDRSLTNHNDRSPNNLEAYDLDNPQYYFKDYFYKNKKIRETIASIIGFDYEQFKFEIKDKMSYDYDVKEAIDHLIETYLDGCNNSDNIRALKDLWNLVPNVQTYFHISRGYSQGDYAEVLFVVTPPFLKDCGLSIKKPYDFKGDCKLYDAWAWGDVYGYSVYFDDEYIDSCSGYYGLNLKESGLLESVYDSIDSDIKRKQKEALEIKTNIKSLVKQLKEFKQKGININSEACQVLKEKVKSLHNDFKSNLVAAGIFETQNA